MAAIRRPNCLCAGASPTPPTSTSKSSSKDFKNFCSGKLTANSEIRPYFSWSSGSTSRKISPCLRSPDAILWISAQPGLRLPGLSCEQNVSFRRPAAVDDQRGAGHRRSSVARQEHDGAGKVLELAEAAELDGLSVSVQKASFWKNGRVIGVSMKVGASVLTRIL